MPEGQSCGDVVLTFLGDTANIDIAYNKVQTSAQQVGGAAAASFDKVGVSATSAMEEVAGVAEGVQAVPPVSPAVPLSFVPVKVNAREARGEVQLLGEAIGIRLPRHVASFVSTMPGVGKALNAAFAATAVGFLLVALVEITEKASNFAAALIYGSGAAKEQMDAQLALNKAIIDLNAQFQTSKKSIEDYGKSALTLADESLAHLKAAAHDATKEVKDQTQAAVDAKTANDNLSKSLAEMTYWELLKTETKNYTGAIIDFALHGATFAQTVERMTDVNLGQGKSLAEVQEKTNDLAKAQADAKAKQEALTFARMQDAKALTDAVTKLIEKDDEETMKFREQSLTLQKSLQDYHNLELAVGKTADEIEEVTIKLPPQVQAFLKIGQAMQTVGIDTVDLRNNVSKQKEAVDLLFGAYKSGNITLRQFQQAELSEVEAEIALAKATGMSTAALEKQEQTLKRQLGQANVTVHNYEKMTHADKVFQQTLKETGSVAQATWAASTEAFESSVGAYASGSATMAQAIEKMVQQELEALSEFAIKKAIAELAMGWSDANTPGMEEFAPGHFTSAALWGSLGGAAAVAGHMMGGSGGSSSTAGSGSSSASKANPATASSTQAQVGVINVQHLAGGGLVSKPTLVMLGDSASGGSQQEAAIPLGDSGALDKIGAAISKSMGGTTGPQIHVHVEGMISPDNLGKVVKQINQRVTSGKSHLTSSNALRVTKRSQ